MWSGHKEVSLPYACLTEEEEEEGEEEEEEEDQPPPHKERDPDPTGCFVGLTGADQLQLHHHGGCLMDKVRSK